LVFHDEPDDIVMSNAHRTAVLCNPYFENIFSYVLEDVIGGKTDVLYAHNENYEKVGELREMRREKDCAEANYIE